MAKKKELKIYRGYRGSIEFDKAAGVWHGKVLNLAAFWKERVKSLDKLMIYQANSEKGLQQAFEDKIDFLYEIQDSLFGPKQ